MKNFSELGIIEPILKSIEKVGYTTPTQVQEESIPLILQGRDIIAGAATGSGKTLAFASAIIEKAFPGKGIQAIVLTPTRELAIQVSEEIMRFAEFKQLTITAIYGGVSISPQMDALPNTDVVVGTPGRVLDHLSRGTMDLSKVKVFVLDEADRMLDMGFIEDVESILSACPKKRQTLLYSATISTYIYGLAEKYMDNPAKVAVDSYVDPSLLTQVYYQVAPNQKFSLLVHFLKKEVRGLVMVFCNTQRATDFVAKNLNKQGIEAIPIHGGLSQARRSHTLERFNSGKALVLVCTDVAARGLHIEGVTHVYNYDIPKEAKQYVHRIGRTARAGEEGIAISLLTEHDYDNFNRVLSNHDLNIERMDTPQVERVHMETMKREGFSGRGRGGFSQNRGPRRGYGGRGRGNGNGSGYSSGNGNSSGSGYRGSSGSGTSGNQVNYN
ncbi:MAG: DEAD/DEAH box helicase [Nanoarchaeota archaeon]|nr:DEAD/DEAH box helicase [Nanoarchaeota archaeon]